MGRQSYDSVATGQFHGNLDLRWLGPNRFLFVPNQENPFRFERANGEIIQPQAMYTDVGSTMPILRGNPHFSPWGYGPAFIIHDWLFFSHSQGYSGHDELDICEASLVLAEATKTIMENENLALEKNPLVMRIYQRTTSGSIARRAIWMRPWYGKLPHPEVAAKTPSIAFDKELPFQAEDVKEMIFSNENVLKARLSAGSRFGTMTP